MAGDIPPTDSITIGKVCDDATLDDSSDFTNGLPVNAKIVYMGKTHDAKNVLSDREIVESTSSVATKNLRGSCTRTASQSSFTQGIAASLGYGNSAESSNMRFSLHKQRSYRKTGSISSGSGASNRAPITRSLSNVSNGRLSRRSSNSSTRSDVPVTRSSLEFARRGSNDARRASMSNGLAAPRGGRNLSRSNSLRAMDMGSLEAHEEAEFEESISCIRADFDDVRGIIEDKKSFAELKATLAESGAITNELLKQILPLYAAQKRQESQSELPLPPP